MRVLLANSMFDWHLAGHLDICSPSPDQYFQEEEKGTDGIFGALLEVAQCHFRQWEAGSVALVESE